MLTTPATGRAPVRAPAFPPAAAARYLGVRVSTVKAAGLNFSAKADLERWLSTAPAEALSRLVQMDRDARRNARQAA